MKTPFPWRDFLKRMAVIAVPVALQNLFTTTGTMVDTMMIASLGNTEVGAVGLCAQFSSLMYSSYWGFVGGGMLFIAQYWGAGDDEGINRSYGLTLTCMMTVAILFWALATFFPDAVMRLYTDKASIQAVGAEYLRVAGFSYPLIVLTIAMAALLRCTECVNLPLYGSITSVVANIILNWAMIFGHLGFPAMGVRGAALATVIAEAIGMAVMVVLAWKQGHPYLLAIREHFRWHRPLVREYLRKCFPIICNEALYGLGTMAINVVLGRQSEEAIAALAVFRTLEGMVIGFFGGFSNAASVLVGARVGAGDLETAYQRGWRLVYLCQGFIAIVGLLMIAFHRPILTMMGMQGESFRIAFGLICVYAVAGVIRMGNWTHNDIFRSAGNASYGAFIEILSMWLLVVPCVWLTGMVWHWPTLAVFTCCHIDEPIRYVMMQRHLFQGTWIRPVTPEGRAALRQWKPVPPWRER